MGYFDKFKTPGEKIPFEQVKEIVDVMEVSLILSGYTVKYTKHNEGCRDGFFTCYYYIFNSSKSLHEIELKIELRFKEGFVNLIDYKFFTTDEKLGVVIRQSQRGERIYRPSLEQISEFMQRISLKIFSKVNGGKST